MLYHISEEGNIARFEPRPLPTGQGSAVWAVNDDRLRNYLLPRDCPRVTFFAAARTTPADVERYLGASCVVVAFEASWLARITKTRLYCYHLPSDGFACVDPCAGYFQSTQAVVPVRVDVIDDCLAALAGKGVEIRILQSLWPLRDAVVGSTLSYSIIRMRNAVPRKT